MSDLALTPDVYCPAQNSAGEYYDRLPYNSQSTAYTCPCTHGKRAYPHASLKSHFQTKKHKQYLVNMNANRGNHLEQFIEAQETVKTQRRIIASLQKELDVAQHRIAGAQHILQSRDKRIGELEAEVFMLRPPPVEQGGGGWSEWVGGSRGGNPKLTSRHPDPSS